MFCVVKVLSCGCNYVRDEERMRKGRGYADMNRRDTKTASEAGDSVSIVNFVLLSALIPVTLHGIYINGFRPRYNLASICICRESYRYVYVGMRAWEAADGKAQGEPRCLHRLIGAECAGRGLPLVSRPYVTDKSFACLVLSCACVRRVRRCWR